MTPAQLLKHYKTQTAAAKAIGICQPTVSYWVKINRIPSAQQMRIQGITRGALQADKKTRQLFGQV